jgi:transcriptional regulator with PAS, ATPase and Fis domain
VKFASLPLSAQSSGPKAGLSGFFSDPRWEAVCDQFPDGVVVADAQGLIVYLNPAAESLNEVRRIEWIGRSFADFIDSSRLCCDALKDAYRLGQRLSGALVDMGRRTVSISTRVLHDSGGMPGGVLFLQHKLPVAQSTSFPAPSELRTTASHRLFDTSALWGDAYRIGMRAMKMNSRILLLGESGVGKTELARRLHADTGERRGQFVHVSCAGIPESLFESEMFGYDRGTFTGALSKGKPGLIEAADGGTLFLDEVGEMAIPLQAKLLLVLESGCVYRLGSTQPKQVDIRVIAATNRDLGKLVEAGKFREDLYHRLSVIPLKLSALRDCRSLIGSLLDHFVAAASEYRGNPLMLSGACRDALLQYHYPGNVRELENIIEYLSVVAEDVAQLDELRQFLRPPPHPSSPPAAQATAAPPSAGFGAEPEASSLKSMVQRYEATLIAAAINRYGSKRKAAAMLQTDIATIVRKSKSRAQ